MAIDQHGQRRYDKRSLQRSLEEDRRDEVNSWHER